MVGILAGKSGVGVLGADFDEFVGGGKRRRNSGKSFEERDAKFRGKGGEIRV